MIEFPLSWCEVLRLRVMSSNLLMMDYGGGDLLRTGAVWPTVGSLPRPVCAGCGQWLVWPAAQARDESALEVA